MLSVRSLWMGCPGVLGDSPLLARLTLNQVPVSTCQQHKQMCADILLTRWDDPVSLTRALVLHSLLSEALRICGI